MEEKIYFNNFNVNVTLRRNGIHFTISSLINLHMAILIILDILEIFEVFSFSYLIFTFTNALSVVNLGSFIVIYFLIEAP